MDIKEEILGYLFFVICIIIVIIIFAIIYFSYNDFQKEFTDNCKKECNKFNYGFYKIEDPGSLQNYNCWCLDDDKPKNIGNIELP